MDRALADHIFNQIIIEAQKRGFNDKEVYEGVISKSMWQQVKRGEKPLSAKKTMALCDRLGLDYEMLIDAYYDLDEDAAFRPTPIDSHLDEQAQALADDILARLGHNLFSFDALHQHRIITAIYNCMVRVSEDRRVAEANLWFGQNAAKLLDPVGIKELLEQEGR